jgi:putative ABC transport system permease protein
MVPLSYNVRSLMVRKVTTTATAFGVALVVGVLAGAMMLNQGLRDSMKASGRPENAIILRDGSDAELPSTVSNDALNLLKERSEVAKFDTGAAAVIGEVVTVITADLASGDGLSNVMIRGTTAEGLKFRPEFKIVDGRAPKPGTDEAIVGQAIAGRFKGIKVGSTFELQTNRPIQIVGTFSSNGSSYESEVWADIETVRRAMKRESVVSSARVRLSNPSQFDSFRASLEADKRLGMKVLREVDYYESQSEGTAWFLSFMGNGAAFLLSLAAMIGAAITMNGAVANRTKEIGTLRALGFSKLAILTSFVFEAIFLALLGGIAGLAVVTVITRFWVFSTMNWQTFSEIVFRFNPTPAIAIKALIAAMVMGLIGGLFPAIRAARVSPIEAMRG